MQTPFSTVLSAVATTIAMIATAARSGRPMSNGAAVSKLITNGITISSSGNCTDRNNPNCTSLEGVLSGTIDTIIALKGYSGCGSLVITGGTETGHDNCPDKTHWNGYKLDVRHAPCLDNYICRTSTSTCVRSDGFPCWTIGGVDGLYCDEGSHWDIVFR
ncbi:hypothetical protein BGZ96_002727 [Linnemannia gamsii]|uniref:Uncharacterized protein n=1 Tax=Linnemannia gamsii TaxID=64522 RepID=A0ABQ7JK80_9FUNG|nr:hypothetical protein BGZ96_002727 [Linnemannia gamsii]